MGVYTFVCRSTGENWTAKQVSGDLEASALTTYELQRKLVQSAVAIDSSGAVQSSFSLITPSSAVFQVCFRTLFVSGFEKVLGIHSVLENSPIFQSIIMCGERVKPSHL